MRNLVAFIHGNGAVHAHMEINIKIQSHFAGPAFLNLYNAWYRSGGPANGPDKFIPRRGVHNLIERRAQDAVAVRANECASNKGRPIIGTLPCFAADKRDGNADKSCDGSHGVEAMVPCVCFDGGAFHFSPKPHDITVQTLL